jgi:cysteine desulfurase/selenocysteine lyase
MTVSQNMWRNDFPGLSGTMNGKPVAFLDSAASAQKLRVVIDAMHEVMSQGYANIHRGLYQFSSDLTARFEAVRARVAAFIGASNPDHIIFTHNTTESINLVAASWGSATLQPDDDIILTAMEHHANIVPWQMVAARAGATIRVWPVTAQGTLDINDLIPILSLHTKMVAFTHVSNVLGTINDVATIIKTIRIHAPQAKILIDGSQAAPHLPLNMADIDADFYVFTGHKIYGPTGVGVLVASPHIMNALPPFMGGGDMIDHVVLPVGTTYRTSPARFEAGTPAIIDVIGLGAAIDYISAIGWPEIIAHERTLSRALFDALNTVSDITIYGPEIASPRIGVFSFSVDWAHPSDIAMILDQCGVAVRTGHHCAEPLHTHLGIAGTTRASIGLYTDMNDIDQFADAMSKAKRMLS